MVPDDTIPAAAGTPAAEPCPPVLMILFNRPDLAEQVFERVQQARPARLYLAVDGARDSRPTDSDLTARCRALPC